MHAVAQRIHAVKAAARDRVHPGDVVTVVGKLLAGGEPRGLTDNSLALDHQLAAILVFDHPLSAEQRYRVLGLVADGDEVNEGMGFVRG